MMSFFDKFLNKKKPPATIAKERLQIILAHERVSLAPNYNSSKPNWIDLMKDDLMEVIAKYTKIGKEDLKINIEKRDNLDLLEINITLPEHHDGEE